MTERREALREMTAKSDYSHDLPAELGRASDALAEAVAVYLEPLDDFETVAGHPLTSLREKLSGYWALRRACPEGRTPHTEEWAGDTMYACGCLLLNDGGECES